MMLPRIAAMVLNQHHLITPQAAEAVLGALDGRIGELDIGETKAESFTTNAFVGVPALDNSGRYKGYRITERGVGIVPIRGELVNRGAWVGSYSGMTSYEGLRHTLRQVAADERVKSIVFDVNSPGGMVSGAFETAALVREIAAIKPVTAVANDMMASAAYLISSGATRIISTDNAQVGSIGVLYVHTDRSGEMAAKGQRVTLIHAGKHKVDGHPFGALPEQVRLDIQARGNSIHGKFIETVVAGRGGLVDAAKVRATEARVYLGEDAVAQGLADSHGTFDQAVADAEAGKTVRKPPPKNSSAPSNDNTPAKEAARMQNEQGGPAANTSGGITEGLSQAQIDHLATAMTAALAQAAQPAAKAPEAPEQPKATAEPSETVAQAHARGRTEERARISAIMNHAEAKDRPIQARVLALDSDVSADQATAMLAKTPKESGGTGQAQSFYADVRRAGGNPQVPAGRGDESGQHKSGALAAGMSKMLANSPLAKKAAPAA